MNNSSHDSKDIDKLIEAALRESFEKKLSSLDISNIKTDVSLSDEEKEYILRGASSTSKPEESNITNSSDDVFSYYNIDSKTHNDNTENSSDILPEEEILWYEKLIQDSECDTNNINRHIEINTHPNNGKITFSLKRYLNLVAILALVIIPVILGIKLKNNMLSTNENEKNPVIVTGENVTEINEITSEVTKNTINSESLNTSVQTSPQNTEEIPSNVISTEIVTEIVQVPVTVTAESPVTQNDYSNNQNTDNNYQTQQQIVTEVPQSELPPETLPETTQEIPRPKHQDHPTDNQSVSGADIKIENVNNCTPGQEVSVKISFIDLYNSKALSLGQYPRSSEVTVFFDEGLEYINADFFGNSGCTCDLNNGQLKIHLDLNKKDNYEFEISFKLPELVNNISAYHVYIPEDAARTVYASEFSSQTVLNYNRCGTIFVDQ